MPFSEIIKNVEEFFLTGTIVNTVGVIIGGILGILIGKGIPEKLSSRLMQVLGLCTLLIGVTGVVPEKTFNNGDVFSQNILLIILSMVIGTLIGELLDLDGKVDRLGKWEEVKF